MRSPVVRSGRRLGLILLLLTLVACARPRPTPPSQAGRGSGGPPAPPLAVTATPGPAAPAPTPIVGLPAADAYLAAQTAAGRFSGAVLVARDGRVLLEKAYGLADRESGLPNTPQTRYHIASLTKQFTAMAILILAQSEADFVTMGGPLDNAAHHSYEQVVIDHDIWEMAQRLTTEIVVDDDTLAYDIIEKMGPGGSFLGETHTRRAVQAGEHYYGGSFNHTGRAGDQYKMLARAHQRVEEILARPFEYCAPPDAVRRIKDYVRDHAVSKKVPPPEWTG